VGEIGKIKERAQQKTGTNHTVRCFSPPGAISSNVHFPFLAIDMLLLAAAGGLTRGRSLDIARVGIHRDSPADLWNAVLLLGHGLGKGRSGWD
jgi:hypothetical protein